MDRMDFVNPKHWNRAIHSVHKVHLVHSPFSVDCGSQLRVIKAAILAVRRFAWFSSAEVAGGNRFAVALVRE